MAGQRLLYIDQLRALAALGVMFRHCLPHMPIVKVAASWIDPDNYLPGVVILLIVSGYSITSSLANKTITIDLAARWVFRRQVRIVPLYWTAILVVLVGHLAIGKDPVTWGRLLSHVVYMQQILGYQQISRPLYSICLLEQIYLLFIACSLIDRRLLVVGGVLALAWPLGLVSYDPVGPWCFSSLCWFSLGVAAYYAAASRTAMIGYLALTATTLAIVITKGQWAVVLPIFMSAGLASSSVREGLGTLLERTQLHVVGLRSFSLYAMHPVVVGSVFAAGAKILGDSLFAELSSMVGAAGGSLVLAWITYEFIEKPSAKMAGRVKLEPDNRTSIRVRSATSTTQIAQMGAPNGGSKAMIRTRCLRREVRITEAVYQKVWSVHSRNGAVSWVTRRPLFWRKRVTGPTFCWQVRAALLEGGEMVFGGRWVPSVLFSANTPKELERECQLHAVYGGAYES